MKANKAPMKTNQSTKKGGGGRSHRKKGRPRGGHPLEEGAPAGDPADGVIGLVRGGVTRAEAAGVVGRGRAAWWLGRRRGICGRRRSGRRRTGRRRRHAR